MALSCPTCENVSMLAQRDPRSRLEIDVCPQCHGLWFDARELGPFLRSEMLRTRFLTRPSAGSSQAARDEVKAGARACPRCKAVLREMNYAGVRLDTCDTCHGTWFDDGEVRMTVERFRKGARSGDQTLLAEIRSGLEAAGEELFMRVREHVHAGHDATE